MPITSSRFAVHPDHAQRMTTAELRSHFLIEKIFEPNEVTHVYSHFDRLIVGGAAPVGKPLKLESLDELKASFYLERRELGIINVGATGTVSVDGKSFELQNKEALYVGMGAKDVVFNSSGSNNSLFYFNSAPAHMTYPTRKITLVDAETTELGADETSNHRIIRKLMVASVLPTCRLQMGLTELKTGSVWNTMPPHTHTRRMEAYFYFNLPDGQAVSHFMGDPGETRHLWLHNHQAVISPPWSIHAGAGTSSYAFIWSMTGENLDYTDMDAVAIPKLR